MSASHVFLYKPEAMIFDMDGTLFQTETLLIPTFNTLFNTLREEGIYEGDIPSHRQWLECIGMVMDDIWKLFLPNVNQNTYHRANELLLELQTSFLHQGATSLYPDVRNTLQFLKKQGVRLFIASNGLEHYVNSVAEFHQIIPLFEAVYTAGQYCTSSKIELVHQLLTDHHVQQAWMVGDRHSDVTAGKQNGLCTIGCTYAGFASEDELTLVDAKIPHFSYLRTLYEQTMQ